MRGQSAISIFVWQQPGLSCWLLLAWVLNSLLLDLGCHFLRESRCGIKERVILEGMFVKAGQPDGGCLFACNRERHTRTRCILILSCLMLSERMFLLSFLPSFLAFCLPSFMPCHAMPRHVTPRHVCMHTHMFMRTHTRALTHVRTYTHA